MMINDKPKPMIDGVSSSLYVKYTYVPDMQNILWISLLTSELTNKLNVFKSLMPCSSSTPRMITTIYIYSQLPLKMAELCYGIFQRSCLL